MNTKNKKILAKGLLEGYAGKSERGSADRAGFSVETSDYSGPEGKYHDEWAADYNGGGQELTETNDREKATRVYAGGTLSADKLQELGITKKDVIGKLIFFVNELKEGTRLDKDAKLIDGLWEYTYKVLKSVSKIPVDVGEEKIKYKGNLVFVHYHIISPVI